nr:uncharacterized mitochondrial protein AtMg00810-like [Tanacetum cinerariifolium]
MYGTLPPILPPLGTNIGGLSNSNVNRVDTMPNIDTTNTSPTINISRSVLDDDLFLPQLLDSRGGSHITNVPTFGPSNTRDIKIVALRLKFNAFEALEGEKVNEDEPSVRKSDARSGQWVEITMKKTCSKLTLDQLISKQILGNIVKTLRGKGRRKENNSLKKVLFTKADVSTSESALMITSDSEDDSDNQEPLPSLPRLTGEEPFGASKSLVLLFGLTANMAELTLNTTSKKLLLTLMEEVKGIKNQILIPSDISLSVSHASSLKTSKQKVDHLGKIYEKEDDGFFLGYSSVAKAFRVFNIMRQEIEETFHVTFSEDDEAISQTSTEGDAIKFNEVNFFLDDEFSKPRTSSTLCIDSLIPNIKDVVPALDEAVHPKSAATFESTDLQKDDKDEPIDDQPLLQVNSPLADSVSGPPVPQDKWSREKHIVLVNIIGEPLAVITTKSKIRDLKATSAHECLYVNFLLEIKPKKLIKALEEEGWVLAMTEEEYVKDLLKKYDLADCASVKCHMLPPNNLGLDESGVFVNETEFRGMVGSLMYLTASRLDIQFSTSLCARYQANPKESHLVVMKRIFRYLKAEAKYVAAAGYYAQVLWIKSQMADYDVIYDKVSDKKNVLSDPLT